MDWSIWGVSFSVCFRDSSRFMATSPPVKKITHKKEKL